MTKAVLMLKVTVLVGCCIGEWAALETAAAAALRVSAAGAPPCGSASADGAAIFFRRGSSHPGRS